MDKKIVNFRYDPTFLAHADDDTLGELFASIKAELGDGYTILITPFEMQTMDVDHAYGNICDLIKHLKEIGRDDVIQKVAQLSAELGYGCENELDRNIETVENDAEPDTGNDCDAKV